MSIRPFLFIAFLSVLSAQGQSTDLKLIFEQSYEIPGSSIRAIELDAQSNLWFAGSNGKYGKIAEGTLVIDSLKYENYIPSFRSLAIRENKAFVLSIENPALLYKLPEPGSMQAPELVYKEEHEGVFYDSMTFLSSEVGVAMGDPLNGCLSILISKDGGNSWMKKSCDELPATAEGEAGFAASNTNIATYGDQIWIGTGGVRARVFRSKDAGDTWEVFDSPMAQGGTMTGIYSLDFADSLRGISVGGNWDKKGDFNKTKAITEDGGINWHLVADGNVPGYMSCVQYVPYSNGKELVACSTEGIYYSENQGRNWVQLSDKGFYSLRFENPRTLWLSKNNEIVKVTLKRN